MKHVVISYVPSLHKGYSDFFKKYHGGKFYVLGNKFVKEFPRMDRDIRALSPEDAAAAIGALGIFSSVEVLTEETLEEVRSGKIPAVMPDDEVNRHFTKTYLRDNSVEFVKTFLRWDRKISTTEFEVPPDRVISENQLDKELISEALKEAGKSPDWWRQVGGVIAKDGRVVLAAYNKHLPSEHSLGAFGDPRSNFDAGESIELSKAIHAEAALIAEAARRGIALEGASLYITTFPCPVCAKSIASAGIKKVYYSKGYSLLDAEDVLRAHGVEIVLVK